MDQVIGVLAKADLTPDGVAALELAAARERRRQRRLMEQQQGGGGGPPMLGARAQGSRLLGGRHALRGGGCWGQGLVGGVPAG